MRDAGLVVIGGFMVGFDNDDAAIFDEQFRFIQDSGIGQASGHDPLTAADDAALRPAQSRRPARRLRSRGGVHSGEDDAARAARRPHRADAAALRSRAYLGRIFKGYRESSRSGAAARRSKPRSGARGWRSASCAILRRCASRRGSARVLSRRSLLLRFAPVYLRFYARNLAFGRGAMPLHAFVDCALPTGISTTWHGTSVRRRSGIRASRRARRPPPRPKCFSATPRARRCGRCARPTIP